MRRAFATTLAELAEQDSRILLLTGDLGFMALEPFAERFPQRYFNVGVAEQNMVGIATGLSEAGFIPFVYSIATFAALRPYEFIRNGPIQHQLPVRIMGVGGGFEYGTAGLSHHGLEDIGVMRIQPDITIVVPADYRQARAALLATWDHPGPIYWRLGKDDKAVIPGLDGRFEMGRAQRLREGDDFLFVTMGSITSEVMAAAELLAKRGIDSTVLLVSTFNPSPTEDIVALAKRFLIVMTVEAHYANGGLGSWVAEVIAEQHLACHLARCAVRATPRGLSGSQDYLYMMNALSADSLAETAYRKYQESVA